MHNITLQGVTIRRRLLHGHVRCTLYAGVYMAYGESRFIGMISFINLYALRKEL